MSQELARFREILSQGPSPEVWSELVAALGVWDSCSEQEIVMSYVESHLDDWPDSLRKTSDSWFAGLLASGIEPRMRLARTFSIPDVFRQLPSTFIERTERSLPMTALFSDAVHFGWSPDVHIRWLCSLYQGLVNEHYDSVADIWPELKVTFQVFELVEDAFLPSTIKQCAPDNRDGYGIESLECQAWKEWDVGQMESFLSGYMTSYIDEDGGMWDIKDVFSSESKKLFGQMAGHWFEAIENVMGEAPMSCAFVTLLFDRIFPRKWDSGCLLRGQTKMAYLGNWYE